MGELPAPVVLLFSLGHQPVAHLLLGFARQGTGAGGGVMVSTPGAPAHHPGAYPGQHDGRACPRR